MSVKLTRQRWLVLNSLADGSEPFEEVYAEWADGADADPLHLLDDVFSLYVRGYVVIEQVPLTSAGQSFSARRLTPSRPLDVVGDLREQFEAFSETRKYLKSYDGGGIPFGVYVEMTPIGREEWGPEEYGVFVQRERR